MSGDDELEAIEDQCVDEFDPGTRISRMNDGSVQLRVPLMPPSWPHDGGPFDCFVDHLTNALGVTVEGWDKELFSIPEPAADTVARLKEHLLALRQRHEKR